MQRRGHHGFVDRKQRRGSNSRVIASTSKVPDDMGNDWGDPVIDTETGTPPNDPDLGDRYIIPCGATGEWAGRAGQIAEWVGNRWDYTYPAHGATVWVEARLYFVTFVQTNQLSGPETVDDADFWFPHHFLDSSHTITPVEVITVTNTPPASPPYLGAYAVGTSPAGAWSGRSTQVAVSVCNALTNTRVWAFFDPGPRLVWNENTGTYIVRIGGSWNEFNEYLLGISVLNDLGDVNAPNPQDGQVLTYNASNQTWVALDTQLPDHSLGVHTNVANAVDSATTGHILRKASTLWTAQALTTDIVQNLSNIAGDTATDAFNNITNDLASLVSQINNIYVILDTGPGGGGGGDNYVYERDVFWNHTDALSDVPYNDVGGTQWAPGTLAVNPGPASSAFTRLLYAKGTGLGATQLQAPSSPDPDFPVAPLEGGFEFSVRRALFVHPGAPFGTIRLRVSVSSAIIPNLVYSIHTAPVGLRRWFTSQSTSSYSVALQRFDPIRVNTVAGVTEWTHGTYPHTGSLPSNLDHTFPIITLKHEPTWPGSPRGWFALSFPREGFSGTVTVEFLDAPYTP